MNLTEVRFKSFQSFGSEAQALSLADMTFLLGPNGSGKTAVLHGLARMFAVDPSLRGVRKGDFHVGHDGVVQRELFIEATFTFPEAGGDVQSPTVPEFLNQMQLETADGPMTVLIRLSATLDDADEITEELQFIRSIDDEGLPLRKSRVDNYHRRQIQLHYLPARRNPRDHISYAPTSILGNALRAMDWTAETQTIEDWNRNVTDDLSGNPGIASLIAALQGAWTGLHRGATLSTPSIGFGSNDLDHLLRQLTVNFTPSHTGEPLGLEMLSDGQQSLLYVSTVIALHDIGRSVLAGMNTTFDEAKLQPPAFTLFAVEEPENSLSPYYLGRIFKLLRTHASSDNCQAVVATHAPSVMKRVDPENVRFLRLDALRRTSASRILLPSDNDDARKYVKQAVEAFPELYFARLVILGEGASEEVVLPRLLDALDTEVDEHAVAVVPLGGRHVNHMWRLLNQLEIPHVTLLDLDAGRFGGGWGRVRTTIRNLQQHAATKTPPAIVEANADDLPKWDEAAPREGDAWLAELETANVFFSSPLDLDFLLLEKYPNAYPGESHTVLGDTEPSSPSHEVEVPEMVHRQVLGKKGVDPALNYSNAQAALFDRYHSLFQLGSKPTTHLEALSDLDDAAIASGLPPVLGRLITRAAELIEVTPE